MAEKVEKPVAKYQSHPSGLARCERCTMFVTPDRCTTVKGKVSPRGWCRYFETKHPLIRLLNEKD